MTRTTDAIIAELREHRLALKWAIDERPDCWGYSLNEQTREQNDHFAELMMLVDELIAAPPSTSKSWKR